MIKKIRIQNYKCLADVSLELGPFNVLIGQNDTGKSSVLEAMEIMGKLATTRKMRNAFEGIANPAEALWWGAGEGCFGFEATIDASGRELAYAVEISSDGRISTLPPGALGGQAAPRSAEVAAQLRCTKYSFSPRDIALPSAPADDKKWLTMETTGKGLASVLDYMLLVERESFDKLEAKLNVLVPYVHKLILRPLKGQRLIEFAIGPNGERVPASVASDGLLLLLGYLTLLYMPPPRPGVILIEEPENGIHPRRLEEVVKLLRELCQDQSVQIVMTTHSPYLLDWLEPKEVHIFAPRRGDDLAAKAVRMDSVPDIDVLRKGYQLGELWFNYGEEKLIEGVK